MKEGKLLENDEVISSVSVVFITANKGCIHNKANKTTTQLTLAVSTFSFWQKGETTIWTTNQDIENSFFRIYKTKKEYF